MFQNSRTAWLTKIDYHEQQCEWRYKRCAFQSRKLVNCLAQSHVEFFSVDRCELKVGWDIWFDQVSCPHPSLLFFPPLLFFSSYPPLFFFPSLFTSGSLLGLLHSIPLPSLPPLHLFFSKGFRGLYPGWFVEFSITWMRMLMQHHPLFACRQMSTLYAIHPP